MNPSVLCAVFQQKFMDKTGGVSRFSVEKFLTHSAENFCRCGGGLWESFRFSLISGIDKISCCRALCHDFRFSFGVFLSHSAEIVGR